MNLFIKLINFLSQRRISNRPWLSFILYILFSKILKYRKKVIVKNLEKSFPLLNNYEIKNELNHYYKHLISIILETIDAYSFDKQEINNSISFWHSSEVQEIIDKNQTFIFTSGHSGNWEMVNLAMALNLKQEIRAIYQPISNQFLNQYILAKRERFGTKMYPKVKNISKEIFKDSTKPFALALINDQSPKPELAFWTIFLNQETGFYKGPAELALKFNVPLVFMHVKRCNKGNYEVISELIKNRNSVEEMLSEYVFKLEKNIKEDKTNWLWSHRRWKHKRPKLIKIHPNHPNLDV